MKEASGDLEQMAAIIEGTDAGFKVYSGDDGLTLPLLAIGGNGVVSVASHVVGNEMQKMIAAFNEGRTKEAAQCIERYFLYFKNYLLAKSSSCEVCIAKIQYRYWWRKITINRV